MKLKYYLRGLGTGILVSTIILMIASGGKMQKLTDEEIIAQAKSLGMEMVNHTADEMIPESSEVTEQSNSKSDTENNTEQIPADKDDAAQPEDETTPAGSEAVTPSGSEPVTPSGSEPVTQPDSEPVTPSGSEAVTPSGGEPVTPSGSEPVTPSGSEPVTQPDSEAASPSGNKGKKKKKISFTVNRGETSRIVSDHLFEAGLIDDAEKFNDYLTANNYDNGILPGTFRIPEWAGYKKIANILTTKQ